MAAADSCNRPAVDFHLEKLKDQVQQMESELSALEGQAARGKEKRELEKRLRLKRLVARLLHNYERIAASSARDRVELKADEKLFSTDSQVKRASCLRAGGLLTYGNGTAEAVATEAQQNGGGREDPSIALPVSRFLKPQFFSKFRSMAAGISDEVLPYWTYSVCEEIGYDAMLRSHLSNEFLVYQAIDATAAKIQKAWRKYKRMNAKGTFDYGTSADSLDASKFVWTPAMKAPSAEITIVENKPSEPEPPKLRKTQSTNYMSKTEATKQRETKPRGPEGETDEPKDVAVKDSWIRQAKIKMSQHGNTGDNRLATRHTVHMTGRLRA